jgi:prepilin-type N-terminal cleavage/methylation domain-containing protein
MRANGKMKNIETKRAFVPARSGFTLVEMLVVITILGILMAMMVPAAGLIMKRAKIANTRSDAGLVATALLKYQSEYNRWPSTYPNRDTTDADWVDMMAPKPGTSAPTNPKRIVFFEPGGGALNDAGAFVDTWGRPFRFLLDVTGQGQLDNPNDEVGGMVRGRALAWSAGPDGDYDTWADNVASWE